ncbi:hypothetical protein I6U48_20700 [Clostridium sp. PL3]|uniref:Uncharacterized protein n=1 Tax=Clostridium thailandense TaxID=2794346 RepID=A0A949U2K8_9CLOT|nr:hypothetical protein [Clostridium thailandense]MBV7275323.1 hypothetical protein [Clostridium thailandense]
MEENFNNNLPNVEPDFKTKRGRGKEITLKILSFIFIILAVFLSYPVNTQRRENNVYNLGYAAGISIGIAVISLVICFLINKAGRKGKKKVGLFGFSIIVLLFSIGNFTAAVIENSKELNAYEYVLEMSDNGTSKIEENQYGKITPLMSIISEDINQIYSRDKSLLNETKEKLYKDELLKSINSIEVLGSVDKIKETRKNLKELEGHFRKYETDINNNKTNTDKKLENVKRLNTEFEKRLLDTYNLIRKEHYDKSIKLVKNSKELEGRVDKYLAFMEEKQGSYRVKDEEIMFYNQGDTDTCNKLIKDIEESNIK